MSTAGGGPGPRGWLGRGAWGLSAGSSSARSGLKVSAAAGGDGLCFRWAVKGRGVREGNEAVLSWRFLSCVSVGVPEPALLAVPLTWSDGWAVMKEEVQDVGQKPVANQEFLKIREQLAFQRVSFPGSEF